MSQKYFSQAGPAEEIPERFIAPCRLQEALDVLEDVDSVVEMIEKSDLSDLDIFSIIYTPCLGHLKNLEKYVEVIAKVYNSKSHPTLPSKFLNLLPTHLIHPLFEKNLITTESIHRIGKIHSDLYFYTAPSTGIPHITALSYRFREFVKDFARLSKDDYKIYRQILKDGYEKNTLPYYLSKDDVQGLNSISLEAGFSYSNYVTVSPLYFKDLSLSLLDFSARCGAVKCFKQILLQPGVVMSATTIEQAVVGGSLEIIHLCEDVTDDYTYPLKAACEYHRMDIFNWIISTKTINPESYTDLWISAVASVNFCAVATFIQLGWMPRGSVTLVNTATAQSPFLLDEVLALLSEDDRKIVIKESFAALFAVRNGEAAILKKVLDMGANPNCITSDKLTPLIVAALRNNEEIVQILLDAGANKNMKGGMYNEMPCCFTTDPKLQKMLGKSYCMIC